jgi:hypothetical protein
MTPFDKVKNQLVVKIKEIYIPDPSSIGGIINKVSKMDFTGANDDDEDKYVKKGKGEDQMQQKKSKMPDFS